jgi:hypothetical protein
MVWIDALFDSVARQPSPGTGSFGYDTPSWCDVLPLTDAKAPQARISHLLGFSRVRQSCSARVSLTGSPACLAL